MNFSDLTLVIPAKEETNCLFKVLEELQSFDIQKIIIIPNDHNFPNDWEFEKVKVVKQKKNGYGNALLEGIDKVETKFFLIVSCMYFTSLPKNKGSCN